MNRSNVDEVIVRVENRPDFPARNGLSPPRDARRDSGQSSITPLQQHQLLPRKACISGEKHESQERGVCEETNDAIWEEVAGNSCPSQENSTTSCEVQSTLHHSQLERVPTESDQASAGPELRRRHSEPRGRSSLDLDIHISDPKIVLLQDNATPAMVDTRSEPERKISGEGLNFSQCDRKSEVHRSPSNSQRVVSVVSSFASTNPPQWCMSAEPKAVEEEVKERNAALPSQRRAASEAASLGFDTRTKLKDELNVKVLGQNDASYGGKAAEEQLRQGGEKPKATGNSVDLADQRKSVRTAALSKELVKIRTKSRLVEESLSSSPPSAMAAAASGQAEKKCNSPHSPVKYSGRRTEAEGEEEDPFKDIDGAGDKFRQGNLTAITVAQWVAFFVVMGCLICSVTVSVVKGKQLWGLELWKWFLLVLVVLCGRLVSGWLIHILVIIFEKNFLLRKKVMYFVYGLRKGVQNCLWLGLVLLAWKLMFDPRVERTTSSYKALVLVTRLLECFLIAAFIWLVKILLVKSLASSFHVTTFFDRIQESLFNQHVLEALSGPPLLDLGFEPLPFRRKRTMAATHEKDQRSDSKISIEDLQKISTRNVSAGLMKRLMHLVRHPGLGTLVTTIDESMCADQDSQDIEINSELEAKAAAKRIFKNVAQPDAMEIVKDDLLRFVSSDEVLKVLSLFEGATDTEKITKEALKNWVVNVYQERKALAHSLNDTKTAVKELHRMASVLVIIIIIVVWLLVLGIATTKVLVFVTSQLLLVGFIFSNTLKQVFEAVIFLFVMHPFDVGDRCIIDGIQLVVEEMKILSTVFLKVDNEKVFYPNSVLATKPISNLYRSPNMKDLLDFSVHISTPVEKINAFKEKITVYVEGKSEQWGPKFSVAVTELADLNRMRLRVSMQHTINFQNFAERLSRRSELLLELKCIFSELGIEYHPLTQPVQLLGTSDSSLPPPPAQLLPLPVIPAPFT